MTWKVVWETEYDDDEDIVNARDAAEKALADIERPGSIAHVFVVQHDDEVAELVDLDDA